MPKQTVAQFLLRRLHEVGCHQMFGVPGDFVLGLMNNVLTSEVELICTCNELNAAYAADAYARISGIGACCTTYVVGELSGINGIAGSFAENVPVVKITGAPSRKHFSARTLLHHTLGDYTIPLQMFSKVTSASVLLNNPDTVVADVDRVLRVCISKSSPVYIAICSDLVEEEIQTPDEPFKLTDEYITDAEALEEAIAETMDMLEQSKHPVIIPGIDIIRLGLKDPMKALVDKSNFPFATMMLAKGVLDEEHPQFIGLYRGAGSREYVVKRIEEADCRITFGVKMTDFNTGGFSACLDVKRTIAVTRDQVQIKSHVYHSIHMRDYISELTKCIISKTPADLWIVPATNGCTHRRTKAFTVMPDEKLKVSRVFDRVSRFLPEHCILLAETGAAMFSATELMLPKGGTFMAQTFYGSIGYTVGATLGACIAARHRRVVTFIGDGSFQVTCQDLSTMIRNKCKPLIFLLNNDGYLIERVIVDRSYNDIQPWNYHKLTEVFGGGRSFDVHTEKDLEEVLMAAATSEDLIFAELHLGKWDCSDSLREAGRQMAINNRLLTKDEMNAMRATV